MDDLESQNQKLKRELKKKRESEATVTAELDETKQDLGRPRRIFVC